MSAPAGSAIRRRFWKGIGIRLLLLGVLLGVLLCHGGSTAAQQRLEVCGSHLEFVARAVQIHSRAHQGEYPRTLADISREYLASVPICPSAGRDTYSAGYEPGGDDFRLACSGQNHQDAGVEEPDYPRYLPAEGLRLHP